MKRFRAAIFGGSGFAGSELIRRLLRHPEVGLVRVCAADHLGEPIASAHPHLEGMTELIFEQLPAGKVGADVDVVLMGLPHDASVRIVQDVIESETRVIDLSGAFRVADAAAYEHYYGAPHPRPDLLEKFVYGLPEMNRAKICASRFVASPGCFATTVELALLPLARAGLLRGDVQVVGVTGSSGSGATPTLLTHHPVRAHNLRTYRPLSHQHVPEIEATLKAAGAENVRVHFVPVSAPLTRGIFATAFARVPASTTDDELAATLRDAYRREPFVRVPAKRLPEVVAVAGSNFAEVGIVPGPAEGATRVVTTFAVTDNLVKGGAGQAIQNMNLMLGLDERVSLEDAGLYP